MSELPKIVEVRPGDWHRQIRCPESKSDMQRILLGCLLSEGESFVHYQSLNQDTEAVIALIQSLGAVVRLEPGGLRISGGFKNVEPIVNVGESGLAARMVLPILALQNKRVLLYGSGSLRNRSQIGIIDSLSDMGARLEWVNEGLPVYVQGPLKAGTYTLDASLSSQFLSGLLFAFPLLHSDTQLKVKSLSSKPYIDLTLKVLQSFGVQVVHENYTTFTIPGNQVYQSGEFFPEGDWSAAAFFIVAAAIAGSAELLNLHPDSSQGDKSILDFIPKSAWSWENQTLKIRKSPKIPSFQADLTHTPDLFPPLTALAANAVGTSILYGTERLINKESNRLETLISEFSVLGVKIWEEENCLVVEGGPIYGGEVKSHNDHRIAMALAVAALRAEMPVIIHHTEAVGKSYPGFWIDFLERNPDSKADVGFGK